MLEEYYVDTFNNLGLLLQRQDNFVSGRRGTGKTTILLRGYFECLKTISPKLKGYHNSFGERKILPIYIDLNSCNEIFGSENKIELLEVHFIRQIISNLKTQLEVMFDEKHFLVFKKENPALDDLDIIEKMLTEGLKISQSSNIAIQSTITNSNEATVGGGINTKGVSLNANLKDTS